MKRIPKVWRVTVILGVLALVAAACGGDDPAPAPAPAPAPVIVEVPVPQPAPDPVIIEVPVPAEAPAPVVIEVPVEAPAPAGPPQVQDMALTTVNINGGPFYAFNLWAAAAALGIADELDIELNVSSQGFFPTAALKRGEFDVIASCPPCAFGVYESIPEFRNWITSYQWRGFQLVGREVDGVPVHKDWNAFFEENDGNIEATNAAFAASLAGRSFAIWEVSSLPTLKTLLAQGGLETSDIVVINFADINVASTAFIAGEGDYHMGDSIQVQRMLSAPELRDKFNVAGPFQAFGEAGLHYSTFASKQDWLDENEETALRLLAIWYRATRYLHNRTDEVLPPLHEAVRRAGGLTVEDDVLKEELFNVELFVRLQDAWDHYFAEGSPTNMDLSIIRSSTAAIELGTIPADSMWEQFEVEKQWFIKLMNRPDLVAWIQKPLT